MPYTETDKPESDSDESSSEDSEEESDKSEESEAESSESESDGASKKKKNKKKQQSSPMQPPPQQAPVQQAPVDDLLGDILGMTMTAANPQPAAPVTQGGGGGLDLFGFDDPIGNVQNSPQIPMTMAFDSQKGVGLEM